MCEFEPIKHKYRYGYYMVRQHPITKYDIRKAYEYVKYAYENSETKTWMESTYNTLRDWLYIK